MPINGLRILGIAVAAAGAMSLVASAGYAEEIALAGDRAYPESIAAASDGTLYVSSIASGGVWRIKPGSGTAEEWIKPGAFDTRTTFGVLVDEKANRLLVCSNDISALGVPGPGTVKGSFLKAFDLKTGKGTFSAQLPAEKSVCNDMAFGADGSLFVANTASPQILKLAPGATKLEVWLESPDFEQPADGGAGLDGIAFGSDGNLYLNTYATGLFFRVEVKNGAPGKITKLKTSRPLKFPDGMRPAGDNRFVMAENGGSIDWVTIKDDEAEITSIKDGLAGPTAVALVGDVVWAPEGQLSHLFDPKSGPPSLPFHVISIPVTK